MILFSVTGSEDGSNRFKIGRWRISSQILNGQKLETSQWIMPKLTPKDDFLPNERKSPKLLNAFQLENPSHMRQNIQGRLSKPNLSHVWLPKTNNFSKSSLQDGNTIF